MASISEFFYKPCTLQCSNCGNDILVINLSHNMGIVSIEGCEWTVYKYGFVNNVEVECAKCHTMLKVSGYVYDGPDEGYLSHCLKLIPLQEQEKKNT
jgi:hypothetical protein